VVSLISWTAFPGLAHGASAAADIPSALAERGICIISGLGYGIDAHAHRSALAGGRGTGPGTIAVLAGGLDREYLSGNADLAAAIRANGLTFSELPPGTAPTRYRFLQRKLQIYVLDRLHGLGGIPASATPGGTPKGRWYLAGWTPWLLLG